METGLPWVSQVWGLDCYFGSGADDEVEVVYHFALVGEAVDDSCNHHLCIRSVPAGVALGGVAGGNAHHASDSHHAHHMGHYRTGIHHVCHIHYTVHHNHHTLPDRGPAVLRSALVVAVRLCIVEREEGGEEVLGAAGMPFKTVEYVKDICRIRKSRRMVFLEYHESVHAGTARCLDSES